MGKKQNPPDEGERKKIIHLGQTNIRSSAENDRLDALSFQVERGFCSRNYHLVLDSDSIVVSVYLLG